MGKSLPVVWGGRWPHVAAITVYQWEWTRVLHLQRLLGMEDAVAVLVAINTRLLTLWDLCHPLDRAGVASHPGYLDRDVRPRGVSKGQPCAAREDPTPTCHIQHVPPPQSAPSRHNGARIAEPLKESSDSQHESCHPHLRQMSGSCLGQIP